MKIIRKILNKLKTSNIKYEPLIEVRIFKDALLNNLNEFQKKYPKVKFAPVIKSNAYGHGLVQVGQILDKEDIAFLIVDSFYEALTLRQAGIKSRILILGYNRIKELISSPLTNCSATIINLETLKQVISKLKNSAPFHLKIDTGMHRQGILLSEVAEAIKLIKSNSNFILEGVCSHFADADGAENDFTEKQIEAWNKLVKIFKQAFPQVKYYHTSNTAGNRFSDKIEANVSRLGVGLYGLNDSAIKNPNLQPAMEVRSLISLVKNIGAGEKVGYGITYESQKPLTIATVPIGYYEGVDRRLSNKGYYKCGGVFCPLVGRVSMNISTIDVSAVTDVKLEDEVVVISRNSSDKNSIQNIAEICGCLEREVLVHVPQHLRRVII